jgi:hypothetical protein
MVQSPIGQMKCHLLPRLFGYSSSLIEITINAMSQDRAHQVRLLGYAN